MATLVQKSEVESEPTEMRETTAVKRQNPRLLLAGGVLLTGLSIAIPSAIMVVLYPLNAFQFRIVNGEWGYTGETWWPYVFAGIALSLACGVTGLVLTIRRRVDAYRPSQELSVKRLDWPAALVLVFAQFVLILAPWVMARTSQSNHPAGWVRTQWLEPGEVNMGPGISLLVLGLACIAAAVWGVRFSDPVVTRRWLIPFGVQALIFAVLGNLYVLVLFFFMGLRM